MPRVLEPELLDDEAHLDPVELERSLQEVWGVNRYLGGNAVLWQHLHRLLGNPAYSGATVRVLDVATGAADIPLALVDWGERCGYRMEVVATDINPKMVDLARRRTSADGRVMVEQADGRNLPYPDGAFDVTICNLALHHMDEEGAVQMLREMARVSRVGWVANDLERHPLAYWGARALALLVWRSPLTRHDGPLSVLRSFTVGEARQLVEQAGVEARVYRHFPFRLAVVGGG